LNQARPGGGDRPLPRGRPPELSCPTNQEKEVRTMIVLTKRNHEKFLVNHLQIEYIETIPESKIVMMNHDYYLVRESTEEIIEKIARYNAKVMDIQREVTVVDKR
jgi:flagellar protein FlbD